MTCISTPVFHLFLPQCVSLVNGTASSSTLLTSSFLFVTKDGE